MVFIVLSIMYIATHSLQGVQTHILLCISTYKGNRYIIWMIEICLANATLNTHNSNKLAIVIYLRFNQNYILLYVTFFFL